MSRQHASQAAMRAVFPAGFALPVAQSRQVYSAKPVLVGPHALVHDEYYGATISNYAIRQQVKPGITGWAQVNGAHGATPTLEAMQRRVDFDAWHVAHENPALDLKILARTPLEIVRPRNTT